MKKNNVKTWATICLVLSIIGIVVFVIGITRDQYDTMWMILIGLMLFLTFIFCFAIFLKQAKHLQNMFEGDGVLAHWVYSSYDDLVENEINIRKRSNKVTIAIITAFFIVITTLFVIFGFKEFEDAYVFIAIMGGVLIIIWAAAILSPILSQRTMKKSAKEAFIGREGAWVIGEYYYWKSPLMRLHGIQYFSEEKPFPFINLEIATFQRNGWQTIIKRIPVPNGEELNAQNIVKEIILANGL